MNTMRIICDKCHGKARITTRREITPRFTKLYCVCNNAECGHSFVMHLEFAHTLSPSGLSYPHQKCIIPDIFYKSS
ncbi:MAG TPA: ogr/Delta-like zinc finger family protein [Nitratidesulfovibrio sp.]|nr:ogr/Delta-like zinc finger family protein [Nitratidesulfovibrio sp.]